MYIYLLYSIKLTLSDSGWRRLCTWYTWADDVVAGGSGEA